jgi:hypothetical protein
MISQDNNGWSTYEKLVLDTLTRLETDIKDIKTIQNSQQTELALIKLKSSIWGAVSGMFTAIIAMTAAYFRSMKS